MSMKLREQIETILWNTEADLSKSVPPLVIIDKGTPTADALVALFKQWALELVGDDYESAKFGDSSISGDGIARIKEQIRERIEESTNV